MSRKKGTTQLPHSSSARREAYWKQTSYALGTVVVLYFVIVAIGAYVN